jgi:hypothetical protein
MLLPLLPKFWDYRCAPPYLPKILKVMHLSSSPKPKYALCHFCQCYSSEKGRKKRRWPLKD